MSELVYIGGFSTGLRIEVWPMRMNRSFAWHSLCPVLRAFMEQERLKRLADRSRQFGIEGCLDTTPNAAERVHGIRIRHTDYVFRKLIVLNELHACSLSLRGAA